MKRSLLVCLLFAATCAVPSKAEDMAEGFCRVGKNHLLSQTFRLREQGVPIDTALEPMQSYYDMNPSLYFFMVQSVRDLYRDPATMKTALNNGTWTKNCVSYVRGY